MKLLILFISFLISQVADSQIISASPPYRVRTVNGCDADAQKFIDSSGISGADATAICALVSDLKSNNLWDSLTLIYPFVGGTSSSCSWNLKDPSLYRLTFNGTITFGSNGADPDGSSGYAETGYNITSLTLNSVHLAFYSGEDVANSGYGQEWNQAAPYDGTSFLALRVRNSSLASMAFSITNDNFSSSNTNGLGFFVGVKSASNSKEIFKNGSSVATNSNSDGTSLSNSNLQLWYNSSAGYSQTQCRYASVGLGIRRVDLYNTAIEAFQDALGRGVQ